MHYRTGFATLLALAILAAAPARAEECPAPDPVPLVTLLLPPPADGSEESIAELHELQAIEAARTPEQTQHAADDYHRTLERFLAGMSITLPGKPAVALALFKCIGEAAEQTVYAAKTKFNRTRPYKYPNNGLHILKTATADDTPSYPSGHATYGTVVGLVLAAMLPEKKPEIMQRIEDFGMSRLVSGVHFRSDVYAGEIAGAAIAAAYFKDAAFRDAFAKAKDDLRKALGYH
jgi:acid phosphatase (class A)